MRPSSTALALGLGLLVAPSLAFCQEVDVDDLQRRGLALREQGRPAEALELFRQAQARQPEPRTLARMGLAEAELARWVDAETHLTAALADRHDRWIRHNHRDLEAELESVRAHLGHLEVTSTVQGARLSINGAEPLPLPLSAPLRVSDVPLNLEVSAAGCESVRRSVTVAARGTERLALAPVCRPTAPPIAEPVVAVQPPPTVVVTPPPVAPPPPLTVTPAAPAATPGNGLRIGAWAAWGGAVVLAGVGVGTMVAGGAAASRWNDDTRCLRPGQSRESLCAGDRDAAESMGTAATVGFVGAGVLAVTGTVLWILSGRSSERPAAAQALRCAPSFVSPSVRCELTF